MRSREEIIRDILRKCAYRYVVYYRVMSQCGLTSCQFREYVQELFSQGLLEIKTVKQRKRTIKKTTHIYISFAIVTPLLSYILTYIYISDFFHFYFLLFFFFQAEDGIRDKGM